MRLEFVFTCVSTTATRMSWIFSLRLIGPLIEPFKLHMSCLQLHMLTVYHFFQHVSLEEQSQSSRISFSIFIRHSASHPTQTTTAITIITFIDLEHRHDVDQTFWPAINHNKPSERAFFPQAKETPRRQRRILRRGTIFQVAGSKRDMHHLL